MVNNVYERSFSYKNHMIQNACNLRYKDAYTSCYICHAKCKKCTKESYTYSTKDLPHKAHKAPAPRGEAKKGLDTTSKRAKKHKTHKLPLNTCTRAKEHTKLTHSIHDRAKSTLSTQDPPEPMH
jgi:hypothetical protein